MAKSKATTTAAEPKQPKTIKVSTLVKAAVIAAALVASFAAGAFASNAQEKTINAEVTKRVKSLTSEQ